MCRLTSLRSVSRHTLGGPLKKVSKNKCYWIFKHKQKTTRFASSFYNDDITIKNWMLDIHWVLKVGFWILIEYWELVVGYSIWDLGLGTWVLFFVLKISLTLNILKKI